MAIQVKLMNRFLQYPRVWLRLQDCEGSSVPPWYNAHLVTDQYPGGRIARLKSTFLLVTLCWSIHLTVAMVSRKL